MLLKFKKIEKFFRVKTFITTINWWVSTGNYNNFNLALHTGDKKEKVLENRKILAEKIWKDKIDFIYLNQVHSDNVILITEKDKWETCFDTNLDYTADAMITNKRWVVLTILIADCVPIIVFDRWKKVIWAIHSGWKWTEKNILKSTILKMKNIFNSNIKDIYIWIWPSISEKNYEVWDWVALKFSKRDYEKKENWKYNLNLQKIVFNQALSLWIADENIEIFNKCSFENSDLFFSARRDWIKSGRFWVWIYLN
jgi:YfiH family protein